MKDRSWGWLQLLLGLGIPKQGADVELKKCILEYSAKGGGFYLFVIIKTPNKSPELLGSHYETSPGSRAQCVCAVAQ